MRIVDALSVALAGLSVIGAVTSYGRIDTRSQYDGTTAAVVDDKGNLRVPSDYRTTYQMLGSWAVAADDGPGSKEMHMVYASPGTIAAYRKDGHFPDGAVLVKEVFKTTTKEMTTGTVSSAGALAGRLQDGLSVLSRAGARVRLDLHARLSGPEPISGAWRR